MATKKKRTPPSGYCEKYPEWSNARYWSFIRSNIRLLQRKWPPLAQLKRLGRRNKPADVPGRHKFEHQCELCSGWFPEKFIEIDHKIPCGSIKTHDDIGPFIDRMLSPANGLQKICKTCHQPITNAQREDRKNDS